VGALSLIYSYVQVYFHPPDNSTTQSEKVFDR